jgi:hypothetical protein|tara:strand:- start:7 stop:216 length:210 start_codon:yes stop_codon:yes gene_type:complete
MSREIDLSGPQGNALALVGIADDLLRQLGRRDEFRDMRTDMLSSDYPNVLRVFEEKFGDLVTLINKPDE